MGHKIGRLCSFRVVEGILHPDTLPRNAKVGKSADLTEREKEVLRLIAEGKDREGNRSRIEVSVKTVEFHALSIRRKLKCKGPVRDVAVCAQS